jgi:hypothetical protein
VVAKTRKKPLGKRAAGVVYLGGKSSSRSGGKVSKSMAATKKSVKKKRR